MKINIAQELRKNTRSLYKKGWLRLLGLTALAFLLAYVAVILVDFTYFSSLLLLYPTIPMFFMITLEINDLIANTRKEKLSFGDGYKTYFGRGRGLFRALRTTMMALLIFMGLDIICSLLAFLVIRVALPDLYVAMAGLDFSDLEAINVFLNENAATLNPILTAVNALSFLGAFSFFAAESRKNEMSFYCFNYLMSANKLRITPLPMTIILFRRELFPAIKKEFRTLNIRHNCWGYLAFYGGYVIGLTIGLLSGLVWQYTQLIAFGLALVPYLPFYPYTRLFDSLFFIAYGDDLLGRVRPEVRELIAGAKIDVMSQQESVEKAIDPETKSRLDAAEGGIVLSDEERKKMAEENETEE